ncbi:MAG: hypothetical protein NC299_14275 [Lachnospiraceae bacterium]|nr:hypothetical protein [Ruminococcus sp.]MCM1276503.1 hypothetical protein [Lachnospiraceae bacterium]
MTDNTLQMLNEVRLDALEKSKIRNPSKRIFDMIRTMCEASLIAREKGLLAMEEHTFTAMPFVCDVGAALDLIVNVVPLDASAEILTKRYWTRKFQDDGALVYYLLTLSVLNIMKGINTRELEELLLSNLPDETAKQYSEYENANSQKGTVTILSERSG